MSRTIKSICEKCRTEITLDFDGLTYVEALKAINELDDRAMECPGYHVEIGGWKKRWRLDEAVENAYTEEEKRGSR